MNRRSQNAMVALTLVLTPNLVNESRVAFSRVAASVTQEASVLNSEVGLPTISPRERDLGLSFITITGFSPLGDEGNNPQNSVTNVYQFLNNCELRSRQSPVQVWRRHAFLTTECFSRC